MALLTSVSRRDEPMAFCCLSYSVCGICYGGPRKCTRASTLSPPWAQCWLFHLSEQVQWRAGSGEDAHRSGGLRTVWRGCREDAGQRDAGVGQRAKRLRMMSISHLTRVKLFCSKAWD